MSFLPKFPLDWLLILHLRLSVMCPGFQLKRLTFRNFNFNLGKYIRREYLVSQLRPLRQNVFNEFA